MGVFYQTGKHATIRPAQQYNIPSPAVLRSVHLTSSPVQDARRVLPKGLLAKLQRHCTGLVYVPSPPRGNAHREMVLRLHTSGMSVRNVAQYTRLSVKWVRHIVEGADSVPPPKRISRFLRLVPPDLVGQVQQYAVGRLYIPTRQTNKTGRTKRIEQLLDQGLSVAEVAVRIKLSQRQVYRLKKVWSENAWRREMGKQGQKSQHEDSMRDERFESRAAAKLCRGCGRPIVGRSKNYCDLCRTIEGGSDVEVIVPTSIPLVSFDPRF